MGQRMDCPTASRLPVVLNDQGMDLKVFRIRTQVPAVPGAPVLTWA